SLRKAAATRGSPRGPRPCHPAVVEYARYDPVAAGVTRRRRRRPMTKLARRELLGAGLGLCAGTALAQQSSQVARREAGTDALGRKAGAPPRRREVPKRMAKTTKMFLTPPGWP